MPPLDFQYTPSLLHDRDGTVIELNSTVVLSESSVGKDYIVRGLNQNYLGSYQRGVVRLYLESEDRYTWEPARNLLVVKPSTGADADPLTLQYARNRLVAQTEMLKSYTRELETAEAKRVKVTTEIERLERTIAALGG